MNQVEIKNLLKQYNNNTIINIENKILSSDYVYFLTQKNGTGKTTFLKCLFNEIKYQGSINLNNLKIVYLPEKVILPSFISCKNYLECFISSDKTNKIIELFNKFDIYKYINYSLDKLSKGTKQKVLLIKTLLEDSNIYLFDEPLSGLDDSSRKAFINEITCLKKDNKIVIIASHYFNDYEIENKKELKLI